jgi:FG-GAP repeat protein/all-beta uncharacterized protein
LKGRAQVFKYSGFYQGHFAARLLVAVVLITFLIAVLLFHRVRPEANNSVPATTPVSTSEAQKDSMPSVQGGAAREYLEKTDDGRSLMEAVTAERFGLKWQERSPFGDEGGGYLGVSHVQNLNAWFDDEGVTIRPTLPKEKSDEAWRLGMRLKAYGYGARLEDAQPIVARSVKDNRIEYKRADCQLPVANCRLENAVIFQSLSNPTPRTDEIGGPSIVKSAIGNRQSAMTEWYENRAGGIEQGFTLNAPPGSAGVRDDGPLRLVVALDGDLRALVKKDGSGVELFDKRGDAVLSYRQLVAKDAGGRLLPARMETDIDGREINLVVEDRGATYPIEIDPITATLEQKLTGPSPQPGAEFGDAVAISGDVAVLGAFREDNISASDVGRVYIFTRSGSTWTFKYTYSPNIPSAQCGWSVAINPGGDTVVFGCPGTNSNTGSAVLLTTRDDWSTATGVNVVPSGLHAGDRYGESVALDPYQYRVFVGSPQHSELFEPHVGEVHSLSLDANLNVTSDISIISNHAEGHYGAALAADREHLISSEPGDGFVALNNLDSNLTFVTGFFPNDGAPGDDFGYSVSISGDTAVVGAPLNDNAKGTDAGAAYVFVRGSNGNWTQQQKLIASDGIDQDQFGESVAIEGNVIVVGSPYNGSKTFVGTRGNGRTYVFTRNINNVWSEQIIISALFDGAPHDQFGIAVAFSGDTIISGAEHATVGNFTDAGAAYIHRLSCVPPAFFQALDVGSNTSGSVCPGSSFFLIDTRDTGELVYGTEPFSYQWRKNGVNIPGATDFHYQINNANASDAGSYDFIVSNSCGAEISTPYTLSVYNFATFPSSFNVGTAGTSGNLAVQTNASCPWTAQSNASWITITSGASGAGNGNVGFTVAANTGPQRTGTMTVGGQTVTVSQDSAAGPVIYVETGATNRAAALDSVTFVRGPFRILDDHNFSADRHTRVLLFTSNLGLTQPDSSILTVQAAGIPLTVENVGPLMGVAGLDGSFIVVRLPDGLATGDLPVTVTLRGVQSSNAPVITISP